MQYARLREVEAKRLARRLLDRELLAFDVQDTTGGAEGIRHVLESLGAKVTLKLID